MRCIRSGLDILIENDTNRLKHEKIGLLAHQASAGRRLDHAADLLKKQCGGTLKMLFGPEHGFFGSAQDMVGVRDATEPHTKLPLISLYGDSRKSLVPPLEHFSRISLLLIDSSGGGQPILHL